MHAAFLSSHENSPPDCVPTCHCKVPSPNPHIIQGLTFLATSSGHQTLQRLDYVYMYVYRHGMHSATHTYQTVKLTQSELTREVGLMLA